MSCCSVYGGLLYLTYHAITTTPTGFIPPQDKGYLLVNVVSCRMLRRSAAPSRRCAARRDRPTDSPGVKHTVSVVRQSILLGTNAPNFGTLYVMLDEFPSRPIA